MFNDSCCFLCEASTGNDKLFPPTPQALGGRATGQAIQQDVAELEKVGMPPQEKKSDPIAFGRSPDRTKTILTVRVESRKGIMNHFVKNNAVSSLAAVHPAPRIA